MTRRSHGSAHVFSLFLLALVAAVSAQRPHTGFGRHWGGNYQSDDPPEARLRALRRRPPPQVGDAREMVHHWNQVAVDSSGLDHTPLAPGEVREFGEQIGPGRSSRAMAIVHIAVFDAVNAIAREYNSYTKIGHALPGTSMEAAIAQAAHDTLVAMFPSQAEFFDEVLDDDLSRMTDNIGKIQGIELGARAAALILSERAGDGSDFTEPRVGFEFTPSPMPGMWRQDPISQLPVALGADWGQVRPFVLSSMKHFRVPPPPPLESVEYAAAYQEVRSLGGDGPHTPTDRLPDQTFAGVFWAYDGTPSLCAPPRLYNQIAMQIAEQMGTNDVVELARLLALVHVAMADAGIAIWESKYYYQVWRPITAIREADAGTGPLGLGDGNPATIGDLLFTPLGAPASNLNGPNFTPPFPSYPSGHAGFGGALFQVLRRFYGTDEIPFTFVSDEFNGVTKDNTGAVRPLMPRSFQNLSQAEEENGQSRIYLGIHFAFDKTEGIAQGRKVADYVIQHAFRPTGRGR